MGELLTPTHLMVVAAVALVLFGGKKLPELGKGLGEGLRGFKDGLKGLTEDLGDASKPAAPVAAKTESSAQSVEPMQPAGQTNHLAI